MEDKSCATCIILRFYEKPYPHWWCPRNPDCPANGDETPYYFNFSCPWYEGEQTEGEITK